MQTQHATVRDLVGMFTLEDLREQLRAVSVDDLDFNNEVTIETPGGPGITTCARNVVGAVNAALRLEPVEWR